MHEGIDMLGKENDKFTIYKHPIKYTYFFLNFLVGHHLFSSLSASPVKENDEECLKYKSNLVLRRDVTVMCVST